MPDPQGLSIQPVGYVRSSLKNRKGAPRQGSEGAPDALLEIAPAYAECLHRLEAGQQIWLFTWLHEARRGVMQVHPRGDLSNPLTGVFATRSPDRPNPIGLHLTRILSIEADGALIVQGLEAIDGTP